MSNLVTALLGTVLLGAALVVTALLTPAGASGTDDGEPGSIAIGDAHEVIPDVVISLPASSSAADDAASMLRALRSAPSIAWAADDLLDPGAPRIVVAYTEDDSGAGPRAVAAAVAAHPDAEEVELSGRAITDGEIGDRIGLGVFLAAAIASLAAGAVITWMMGPIKGLLAGLTMAASTWLAGSIGGSVAGRFDGSLVSTSVPAILTAIVVTGYLIYRLMVWFLDPTGDDQADMIRRSVMSVAIELALVFGGLVVAVIFLELVGLASSAGTVALVGALTASLLSLAIVPAALAALVGSERTGWLNAFPIPTGRDFPIAVLAAFGIFLALLALNAFRSTGQGELLDERALGEDAPAVVATRDLLASGGDPTAAVYARFPDGTDQQAKSAWLEQVSVLPAVARVDTPNGRFQGGAFTAAEDLVGLAGISAGDDEAPRFALIVPDVTGRSPGAIELVEAIEAIDGPVEAELGGTPVDARTADERDRSTLWLVIITLAFVAGASALALIGDPTLAALSFGLRLLGLAAVAGVYRLLVGDASGAEIQLAVFVVGIGVGLFELGYLHRLLGSRRSTDTDGLLDDALDREGTATALAFGLMAVAALGLLVPDLSMMRRLAILLVVVVGIETVVGVWLLRPAVLGTRAIGYFASHPVRVAMQALRSGGVTSDAEHKAWVEVVSQLLWTEFSLQADPRSAVVEEVFAPETPTYRKSVEHHENLAAAGLRIVGRPPALKALKVVDNASPANVVVTVDHPVRQLIDAGGKVVGVRRAERRSVMLWLVLQADGTHRIIDAVELGAVPLGDAEESARASAVVPASAD